MDSNTVKTILDALDQEISWCKTEGVDGDYETGFFKGIIHAKNLIKKIQIVDKTEKL